MLKQPNIIKKSKRLESSEIMQPMRKCLERIQQAIRHLLSRFTDYLLKSYTDYFDDLSPPTPFHLGGMLQCAAILDRAGKFALGVQGHPNNRIPLHLEAGEYKGLLNWFSDYSRYSITLTLSRSV